MTVVREAAIAAFVPEKFYTVDLELTSGCTASSRRIPEKSVAENLLEACRKEMVATIQRITRKEKSENPPPLYDLTTLQRDANRLLGYSAQQTLDYVQSLYEKKLTTYPRTDSCYITDDDEEMLEELTEELEGFLGITPENMDEAVPRTRRTVNREKVTDHHAILPTRSMLQADLEALPKGEQNVLKLIIARTLMAVSNPFRYLETLLTTECAGEEFTAKGKEVLEEGWKAVERKVLADILNRKQELTALPNAAENECGILNAELKEGQTSPPKHFTETPCCTLWKLPVQTVCRRVWNVRASAPRQPELPPLKNWCRRAFWSVRAPRKPRCCCPRIREKPHHRDARRNPIPGNDRRLGNKAAANRAQRNGAERIYDRDQYDDYRTGKEHGNEKRSECAYEKQDYWYLPELRCKCCGA